MSEGPIVLGVDGGGSRSEARLWRRGREVARAAGAALNPNHGSPEESGEALVALLLDLGMPSSVLPPAGALDAACVGLSGVSHPASRDIVRNSFQTAGIVVRGPCILVGDAELVLEAAFGPATQAGVVVVCGTGSIALARGEAGTLVRAGGEGPARGDPGGGLWIAREAIVAGVVAAPPGGVALASLVPDVLAAARRGDARARLVLVRAASELAALARRAGAAARLAPAFPVCASGGVARHAPELLAALGEELARGEPPARLMPVVEDPLAGALALATRALDRGQDVPPGW